MVILWRIFLPLATILGFCCALPAQNGASLVGGDPFGCFTTMDGSPANASQATVAVDGPGFTKAWDLRTSIAATNPWDIRLRCFTTQPAVKGDTIVATFWMRTLAPGQGQTQGNAIFVFERGASPYDKDVSFTASAGSAWQRFDVVFQSSDNYTGASDYLKYNLSFWVNYAGQEVQIGGFSILDYGPNFDAGTLNLPPPWPYVGHDPNASWRRLALDRIERIRKADVALVLRDAAGRPLADVPVHLQMKKHAFGWGTAVDSRTLHNNPAYAQAIKDNFNKIVLENDLKWPPFEDPAWSVDGKKSADFGLNWAKNNDFSLVRGHNIIWPGSSNLPADVQNLLKATPVDQIALSKRIDGHFQEVVTFTKGRVTEWDVINEPFWNHDVQAVLGDGVMAHWFQLARQYDPDIKLYLNDACIGEACGVDQQHIDYTSNVVKGLVSAGAPIDALGLQSHMDSNLTPPERALHYFDYWANSFKPGLQLQVTEFDVNVPMESVQADFTRDYMIAAFSHPAMTGFMLWGFWEGQHWLPKAAMLRLDWSEKPNYKVWRDLVYKQWWTDVTGATSADGVFHTRAFLGDYDLSYTLNGVTKTVPLRVNGDQLNYSMAGPAPAAPQFNAGGVTNAASHLTGPVSPGEMLMISGAGIGLSEPEEARFDDAGKLPAALGLTRVLFDGTPATLLSVSPGQVIAIVPPIEQSATSIVVETLNVQSGAVSVPVAAQSPAFFNCYSHPGTPLMFPQAGPLVLSCDRGSAMAAPGQAVVFFATGLGGGTNQVLFDGTPAPACRAAGIAKTSPGVWEVDTCIPPGAALGSIEVRLQSGASLSPPVQVNVQSLPFPKVGRNHP